MSAMTVNPRGDHRGDHEPRHASVHRTRPGAGRSDPRAGAIARHRDHGTADRLPRSRRLQRDPRSRHGGESDLRLVAAAPRPATGGGRREAPTRDLPRPSSRTISEDDALPAASRPEVSQLLAD